MNAVFHKAALIFSPLIFATVYLGDKGLFHVVELGDIFTGKSKHCESLHLAKSFLSVKVRGTVPKEIEKINKN